MKIIIIEKCNTPTKSYRAGVFKGEKGQESYSQTEIKALKNLVEKLEKENDKWI